MSDHQFVQCLIFVTHHGAGPQEETQSTSEQQPSTSEQQPSTSEQQPSTSEQQEASTSEQQEASASEQQASTSEQQLKVKAFALLPHVVKNDRPEVCEIFSKNEVQVINVEEEYSLLHTAVKNDRAGVLEVLLCIRDRCPESNYSGNHSHIIIQKGLEPLARLLFPTRVYIATDKPKSLDVIPAVDEENSKFIDRLLGDGASIRYRYPKGESLLHFTAVEGLENLVRHLLKHDKSTSLHAASKLGFAQIVKELLEDGADPNVAIDASTNVAIDVNPHLKGVYPLHLAIGGGHAEVVQLLLDSKADVNARTFCGKSVLQAAIEKGRLEIVETVLNYKPDVNNPNNKFTFRVAVSETSEEFRKIVQRLLRYGFTVEAGDVKNADLLLGAIRQNCLEIVRKLIELGASVDRRCGVLTPLHIAAKYAHEEMLKLLIEKGANPDARCYLGWTPLMNAAEEGRLRSVEILLNEGSDIHAIDANGFTPLHVASNTGQSHIVSILLRNGANVNVQCKKGRNPLFLAAQNGHLPTVEELAKSGGDVNVQDSAGKTALHAAAEYGCPATCVFLIQNGADINAECNEGLTALLYAVQNRHADAVDSLLQYGPNINSSSKNGKTALFLACEKGCSAIVETLLQNGADVNAESEHEGSPLVIAAKNRFEDVVNVLLRFGANTSAVGQLRRTALHEAAEKGNAAMVENLLLHGADPNAEDVLGYPPMNLAAVYYNSGRVSKVVEILLKFGARLDIGGGTSLFHNAAESSPDTFKALLEHSFTDTSIIKRTSICNLFEPGDNYTYRHSIMPYFTECSQFLAKHVVKANVANPSDSENRVTPHWPIRDMTMQEYERRCEAEMERLQNECVGDTDTWFYDVLMGDVQRLAGLARNESVCEIMAADELDERFPIYASIMKRQFRRGCQRIELRKKGIRICRFLFSHFAKLPDELKDKIINYLSDADLLILIFACSPRNS